MGPILISGAFCRLNIGNYQLCAVSLLKRFCLKRHFVEAFFSIMGKTFFRFQLYSPPLPPMQTLMSLVSDTTKRSVEVSLSNFPLVLKSNWNDALPHAYEQCISQRMYLSNSKSNREYFPNRIDIFSNWKFFESNWKFFKLKIFRIKSRIFQTKFRILLTESAWKILNFF